MAKEDVLSDDLVDGYVGLPPGYLPKSYVDISFSRGIALLWCEFGIRSDGSKAAAKFGSNLGVCISKVHISVIASEGVGISLYSKAEAAWILQTGRIRREGPDEEHIATRVRFIVSEDSGDPVQRLKIVPGAGIRQSAATASADYTERIFGAPIIFGHSSIYDNAIDSTDKDLLEEVPTASPDLKPEMVAAIAVPSALLVVLIVGMLIEARRSKKIRQSVSSNYPVTTQPNDTDNDMGDEYLNVYSSPGKHAPWSSSVMLADHGHAEPRWNTGAGTNGQYLDPVGFTNISDEFPGDVDKYTNNTPLQTRWPELTQTVSNWEAPTLNDPWPSFSAQNGLKRSGYRNTSTEAQVYGPSLLSHVHGLRSTEDATSFEFEPERYWAAFDEGKELWAEEVPPMFREY